jgi:uncharacterized protein YndB with AHSA1/START domain
MTAIGADQVEFMAKAGMPVVTTQTVTYLAVEPPHKLVYRDVADFVPGVAPYEVETVVEMNRVDRGTQVVLTFDAMHDDNWTEMSRLGRENELRNLEKLLASRS